MKDIIVLPVVTKVNRGNLMDSLSVNKALILLWSLFDYKYLLLQTKKYKNEMYVYWSKNLLPKCKSILIYFSNNLLQPFSYLNTTANISPPSLWASHRFFKTATFKHSQLNLAYKLVWIDLPIPSKTIRSTPWITMASTRV